jgi:hypothetical protein
MLLSVIRTALAWPMWRSSHIAPDLAHTSVSARPDALSPSRPASGPPRRMRRGRTTWSCDLEVSVRLSLLVAPAAQGVANAGMNRPSAIAIGRRSCSRTEVETLAGAHCAGVNSCDVPRVTRRRRDRPPLARSICARRSSAPLDQLRAGRADTSEKVAWLHTSSASHV